MIDRFLELIALMYGVPKRQLTVGQIEDFLAEKESGMRREEAREELIKENSKVLKLKEKRLTEKRKPEAPAESEKAFEAEFESLWTKYPRKDGKRKALVHYMASRRRGASVKQISDGIDRYLDYIKRNGIKTQFVKMGSSYFCQEAWNDQLTGGTVRTTKDYSRLIAEVENGGGF